MRMVKDVKFNRRPGSGSIGTGIDTSLRSRDRIIRQAAKSAFSHDIPTKYLVEYLFDLAHALDCNNRLAANASLNRLAAIGNKTHFSFDRKAG